MILTRFERASKVAILMEHLTKFVLLYKQEYGKNDTLIVKQSKILDLNPSNSQHKVSEKDLATPNLQMMFSLAFQITTNLIDSLAILKIPENSFSKAPNNVDSDNDVDEEEKRESSNFILPLSLSENQAEILSSLFEISSNDASIQAILNNI